jgi:hypothetical protein
MFLPFPPHGNAVRAFAVLSVAILGACFVWWGLRSPTRLAWSAAIVLAAAWLLNSIPRAIVSLYNGHYAANAAGPAVVFSYLVVTMSVVAQTIVLLASWRAARTARG